MSMMSLDSPNKSARIKLKRLYRNYKFDWMLGSHEMQDESVSLEAVHQKKPHDTPVFISKMICGRLMIIFGMAFAIYCCVKGIEVKNRQPWGLFTRVVIHDGKVFAVQPNNSVTALDIRTGDIKFRSEPLCPPEKKTYPQGFIVKPYGNVLLIFPCFEFSPHYVINANDGKFIVSGFGFNRGFVDVYDEEMFILAREKDSQESTVCRINTFTGEVTRRTHIRGRFDKIYVDEKYVYIEDIGRMDSLRVLNKESFLVEDVNPDKVFQNKVEEYFSTYIYYPSISDIEYAEEKFKIQFNGNSVAKLSSSGIVAISNNEFSAKERIIHFDDGRGVRWEMPLLEAQGYLRNSSVVLWNFTTDGRYLVYANNYGKIACRNMGDGSEQWVYAFSRVPMEKWERGYASGIFDFSIVNWMRNSKLKRGLLYVFLWTLGDDFYTEDKNQYEDDIFFEKIPHLHEKNITVDDRLARFDSVGANIASVVCWTVSAFTAFMIFILIRPRREVVDLSRKALFVFMLDFVAIVIFGRYDRYFFTFLLYSIMFIYFYVGYTFSVNRASSAFRCDIK